MKETARPRQAARRRRKIRNTIILIVAILLLLAAAVFYLQRQVQENYATTDEDSVLSAEATVGSISTTVSGSGTLASEDTEDVTIPSGVEIDELYVEEGDSVEEGDLLATIDTSSVLSALSDVQDQLDELDEELEEASEDEVSSTVTAGVSGRVKAIFAEAGDDVATVVYENGALVLLSLDGYMAVDIESSDYEVGDSVTVTTSDGDDYTGSVSAVTGTVVTILITDNGPEYGDTVTVDDSYTSVLYIHEPLKVTGYAGTVKKVKTSLNAKVSDTTTLLTLTDTSYSANYDQLLTQRAELEELYQTLVKLYKDGAVYAELSGTVDSVTDTSDSSSSSVSGYYYTTASTATSSDDETTIVTIDPDETMSVSISVDETDILSLEVGQEAAITIESIGDDTYSGTLTEIDETATSSGGVTVYTATVTLDKTEQMLSGMTASVYITIEGTDNALLVPEDAVSQTSSTAYVYTSYDETTGELGDMVEVTTGLSNGTYIEITSGLSEGDTVYYFESSSDSSFDFSSMMGGGTDFSSFSGSDFSSFSGSDFSGGGGGGNMGGGMSMPGN
ncbi:MAG: HlyD family efflux transporter periplasmic adaptor subunit [Clostridiales bacterium]|nr:HlyD family efflux transporter periplasmic adaptor subunit [Clostridiales bacterium]